MANTKGLGKGLSALLGDDVIAAKDERASSLLLPISQVESCSTQPRKSFEPEALSDLADSIRIHGIIQPLTVRKLQSGYYQIIAGERRWRAARMAGLTQVPVVVIEADDRKAMELAMIENLQREDLNPIEEAEGYRVLTEQYGMTQDECAQRVGKSRPTVANALRLLGLTEPVRAMVEDGRLSAGHARALLTLGSKQQQAAAETVVKDALSVRQTELLVIGADTVVCCEGKILGKPHSREAAAEMLTALQGRSHEVYTGVTLYSQSETVTFFECTQVEFYPMTEVEISEYIDSKEPMDKAGAYGIQGLGARFVKGIRGDYNNVVGLPVGRLYQELKSRGWM